MLAAVSPRTDRSSHNHGTRGKPGPAAPPAPLARMGGMATRDIAQRSCHANEPRQGHCRGSGLNDVHRGVGGTVVTVSSPYAKFMTHNASLSYPAVWGVRVARFARAAAKSKLIASEENRGDLPTNPGRRPMRKSRFRSRSGCCRVIGGLDGRRANLARGRQDCCGCAEFYADRTGGLPGMGTLPPSRIYQGLRSVSVLVLAVLAAC